MTTMTDSVDVRLTQYSHGAGCGCKLSPADLQEILASNLKLPDFPDLIVGNQTSDDAAVVDIGNNTGVVSTTDFFMPIVDDPFDFGRIAVTNAISDVFAMGGKPIMAIAVLGWPMSKLPASVAGRVVDGGRKACADVGIALAGGHSIDTPEPIFGAAVTGVVELDLLKRNDQAQVGDILLLSKPLGIGVLTTAEKKGLLQADDRGVATQWMCRPNAVGAGLARVPGVNAITDVTGFGLLGHLLEMVRGSGTSGQIEWERVPRIARVDHYIEEGAVPGGTQRNFASYGQHVSTLSELQKAVLCDPQTSGGLLISAAPESLQQLQAVAESHDVSLQQIGTIETASEPMIRVV